MKYLLILFCLFFLVSCESESMGFDSPLKFSHQVQYFRDWKGNCFAIVGVRNTRSATMNGVGLANVPSSNCD